MRENLSTAIEDYLKTIYSLTCEHGRATTNQIADRMGVKPGSVTGMVQKMASNEPPLVEYRKYHGVVLTESGETVALEMIRHHRLLELYLQKILGYSWDEVHGEADRLEHVISEDFEERIASVLGDPQHDPHGEPIPSRDFQLPPQTRLQLINLRSGQQARVVRVEDMDANLLRHLAFVGVVPSARVSVLDYSPLDDNLHLQVEGRSELVVLGPRITRKVFVELI